MIKREENCLTVTWGTGSVLTGCREDHGDIPAQYLNIKSIAAGEVNRDVPEQKGFEDPELVLRFENLKSIDSFLSQINALRTRMLYRIGEREGIMIAHGMKKDNT